MTVTGILEKRRRDEQSARSAFWCRIFLGVNRVRKGTGGLRVYRASRRGIFATHRGALPALVARTTRLRHPAAGTRAPAAASRPIR